jgi:hypothetical protein
MWIFVFWSQGCGAMLGTFWMRFMLGAGVVSCVCIVGRWKVEGSGWDWVWTLVCGIVLAWEYLFWYMWTGRIFVNVDKAM